jgi:hypothetical protein
MTNKSFRDYINLIENAQREGIAECLETVPMTESKWEVTLNYGSTSPVKKVITARTKTEAYAKAEKLQGKTGQWWVRPLPSDKNIAEGPLDDIVRKVANAAKKVSLPQNSQKLIPRKYQPACDSKNPNPSKADVQKAIDQVSFPSHPATTRKKPK